MSGIEPATHLTADGAYKWAEEHPIMIAFRNQFDEESPRNASFTKGIMRVTEFGKRFYAAVIDDSKGNAITATFFDGIPVVNLKQPNTTAQ